MVFFFLAIITTLTEQFMRPSVISQIISYFPFPNIVDSESPVVFTKLKVRDLEKERIKQNFKLQGNMLVRSIQETCNGLSKVELTVR